MSRRLVIVTEIVSPYRIPLFNTLAERGDVDPHVIFLAETDPELRQWKVYKEEIRFSYQVLPCWRWRVAGLNVLLNRGVAEALEAARPHVVLCGGYNYVASWQALSWARARNIPFVLWSESNLRDLRSEKALVELLKREFLHRCNGFVVPGRSAFEYLVSLNMKPDSIFTAVNAVDNTYFARASAYARERAAQLRCDLKLPDRYFLFVGRLVKEKGVFDLLSAYAKLDERIRLQVGLVFVGDGERRQALVEKSRLVAPGSAIQFRGFAHREQLAHYYALADLLILPTHSDPWGLVVNEAMACGLPVVLSNAAGCAADLVSEGWNGMLVEPGDALGLSTAMTRLAGENALCRRMGANSVQRISTYTPADWCSGVEQMMDSFGDSCD